jgi:uncharacterized protein (UPF0276 family)
MMQTKNLKGAGWALRPANLKLLEQEPIPPLDFLAICSEEWLGLGGLYANALQKLGSRYSLVSQGRGLSLGGPGVLDRHLVDDYKKFIKNTKIAMVSEQLVWSADDMPLFGSFPIPGTYEAVRWTANRIAQVQDALGMQIGVCNVAHFMVPPDAQINEAQFITEVVKEAGCTLHLDVGALYANSQNFGFDAQAFVNELPLDALNYVLVSGFTQGAYGLVTPSRQQPVNAPVWQLLASLYETLKVQTPTCLMYQPSAASDWTNCVEDVGQIARLQFRVQA